MKKINITMSAFAAAICLTLSSCGGTASSTDNNSSSGSTLGDAISAITHGNALGNMWQSIIGNTTVKEKDLIATWRYSTPGCAFSSKEMLAKAGGEAVAAQVKQKLNQPYQTVGITTANTTIIFSENKQFSATIAGHQFSGTWTFDQDKQRIRLKMLLMSIDCYAKKNSDGMGILFESTKLLTLFQAIATVSGNKNLQTISDLSKHYDGLRMGFDMKK